MLSLALNLILDSRLKCKFEALFKLWPGLEGPEAIKYNMSRLSFWDIILTGHNWECEGSSQERAPNFPQATDLQPANHPRFTHTPGSVGGAWRSSGKRWEGFSRGAVSQQLAGGDLSCSRGNSLTKKATTLVYSASRAPATWVGISPFHSN